MVVPVPIYAIIIIMYPYVPCVLSSAFSPKAQAGQRSTGFSEFFSEFFRCFFSFPFTPRMCGRVNDTPNRPHAENHIATNSCHSTKLCNGVISLRFCSAMRSHAKSNDLLGTKKNRRNLKHRILGLSAAGLLAPCK